MSETFLWVLLAILTILCSSFPAQTSAQFPTECFSVENFNNRTCCPVPTSSGAADSCGADLGRGQCEFIPSNDGDYQPHFPFIEQDDRARWPSKFFKYGCKCNFPFGGADCGDCVFGYYGLECEEKKSIIRRNLKDPAYPDLWPKLKSYLIWSRGNSSENSVLDTSPSNFTRTEDGILIPEFTTPSIYNYFVWIHTYGSQLEYVNSTFKFAFIEFNHLGPASFPWHKKLVLEFERALQKLSGDYDFAIPYWNWMAPEDGQCDICDDYYFGETADMETGELSDGAFMSNWSTICYCADAVTNYLYCNASVECNRNIIRTPGNMHGYPRLPLREHWGFALKLTVYDNPPYNQYANCSFRNIYAGGGDCETGLGLGDITLNPVFSLHGAVHWYLGGTMSTVPKSANDPIFWVHHSNVDRLFEQWVRIQGVTEAWFPASGASLGHNRDNYLVPWFPVITNGEMFQTISNFGIEYDNMDANGMTSDLDWYATDNVGYCEDVVRWSEWPF